MKKRRARMPGRRFSFTFYGTIIAQLVPKIFPFFSHLMIFKGPENRMVKPFFGCATEKAQNVSGFGGGGGSADFVEKLVKNQKILLDIMQILAYNKRAVMALNASRT